MPGKVGTREEWIEARKALLEQEKAWTRTSDALVAERQALPMVKVDKEYTLTGPSGKLSFADVFNGRKQLIVYHFMFGPEATEGCHGCSYLADQIPRLDHLNHKDTEFVCVSRAPLDRIEAFRKRMGWTFPWYSSLDSDFNYDYHVTLDEEKAPVEYNFADKKTLEEKGKSWMTRGEMPGLSVFFKEEDGQIYHTYSAYARGLEPILSTSAFLDYTPLGRRDKPMGPGGYPFHTEYES